ncbi:MAG: DNA-processing protein DprA [bacterium]|nr:DNA-processing protein DprA [bacterium]
MPSDNEIDIRFWMALTRVGGVGGVTANRLVEHFGSAKAVFDAAENKFKDIKGIRVSAVKGIAAFKGWEEIDREIDRARRLGISIISLQDSRYPGNLINIPSPPLILYVMGRLSAADAAAIAVVGSRNPSSYGLEMAGKFSAHFAKEGLAVVSGLARGIDTAAHKSALKAGGRTIAVLGCGIDVVYPPESSKLFRQIADNGVLISEFPLGTQPDAMNFPRRNRIISGLSLGVLVVEAALKSGSLITANYAAEQGRDVYVIPGNINSARSKGSNRLINDGAMFVDAPETIIEDLQPRRSESKIKIKSPEFAFNEKEAIIFDLLSQERMHIDNILKISQMNISEISTILLNLEMMDAVKQHPGKFYSKNTI